ncbi:aldo/keto reductase [Lactococcus lactis]|uniref:aldo/keto reductase n=1 Tax=Lactococcus lactis TaxID=1358 RepID=UPI0024181532|nr:aldo/keto reductase [Lactococcus lactis]MDG4963921.1 aldo/keto reductase [Lactococcus lactis]
MKFEKIKNTNIEVSKICLGGMSFGKAGSMHDWTLDKQSSEKIVKHALNNNINFFDTANGYSKGTGEKYLGRALKNNISRDKVIIASKVYFNPGRLSRKAIFREIEGSLKRLGTDYLDFYIIHRFDYETPIEETMEALNDLVKSGKVRAIGASAMYGYQFQKMQNIAEKNNWAKFTVMENHYNLLYREDERELIPICKEQEVSLIPYSPLASGRLARPEWVDNTYRSKTDLVAKGKYDHTKKFDLEIVNRVNNISTKYDVSMSQIALAWQWAKGISSPIIGATKEKYIDDAINALDLTLTKSDIEYLEQPYVPHKIIGAIDKNPPEGVVLLNVDKNK